MTYDPTRHVSRQARTVQNLSTDERGPNPPGLVPFVPPTVGEYGDNRLPPAVQDDQPSSTAPLRIAHQLPKDPRDREINSYPSSLRRAVSTVGEKSSYALTFFKSIVLLGHFFPHPMVKALARMGSILIPFLEVGASLEIDTHDPSDPGYRRFWVQFTRTTWDQILKHLIKKSGADPSMRHLTGFLNPAPKLEDASVEQGAVVSAYYLLSIASTMTKEWEYQPLTSAWQLKARKGTTNVAQFFGGYHSILGHPTAGAAAILPVYNQSPHFFNPDPAYAGNVLHHPTAPALAVRLHLLMTEYPEYVDYIAAASITNDGADGIPTNGLTGFSILQSAISNAWVPHSDPPPPMTMPLNQAAINDKKLVSGDWQHRMDSTLLHLAAGTTSRLPLNVHVSSPFGGRAVAGGSRFHKGVDFSCPVGTFLYSPVKGKVIYSAWNSGGYGNLVVIQPSDGRPPLAFAHLSKALVMLGMPVEKGSLIAKSGSTGNSTGPHLHVHLHKPRKEELAKVVRSTHHAIPADFLSNPIYFFDLTSIFNPK